MGFTPFAGYGCVLHSWLTQLVFAFHSIFLPPSSRKTYDDIGSTFDNPDNVLRSLIYQAGIFNLLTSHNIAIREVCIQGPHNHGLEKQLSTLHSDQQATGRERDTGTSMGF